MVTELRRFGIIDAQGELLVKMSMRRFLAM
jgi:hypothetical protein